MIAKGFTPGNGAKVFAIMKHPSVFHDREDFNTPWSSKPFAIMKIPPKRSNRIAITLSGAYQNLPLPRRCGFCEPARE
jgi:hypothetical protein